MFNRFMVGVVMACWRRWALVAALALLAWLIWALHGHLTGRRWAEVGAAAVAGLVFHQIARRHAIGWVIDVNGERQKVLHWNRGYPVFVPTSRGQRIVEEAEMNHQRRRALLWSTLIAGSGYFGFYYLYDHHHVQWAGVSALVAMFVTVVAWLPMAVYELLYQIGFQDMKGAKVLDPEPYRPGPDEVARQKVHGDADVATQAEARDLLGGR